MRVAPSKFKRAITVGAAAALMCGGLAALAQPASAAIKPGMFIFVDAYGGASGLVDGATGSITSVLTAPGAGTGALANGTASIATFDTGADTTSTPVAVCPLYDATADDTLIYVSSNGISQTFYRTCAWVLGGQTCSVRSVSTI